MTPFETNGAADREFYPFVCKILKLGDYPLNITRWYFGRRNYIVLFPT